MRIEMSVPSAARADDGYIYVALDCVFPTKEQFLLLIDNAERCGKAKQINADFVSKQISMRISQEMIVSELLDALSIRMPGIEMSLKVGNKDLPYDGNFTFAELLSMATEQAKAELEEVKSVGIFPNRCASSL